MDHINISPKIIQNVAKAFPDVILSFLTTDAAKWKTPVPVLGVSQRIHRHLRQQPVDPVDALSADDKGSV